MKEYLFIYGEDADTDYEYYITKAENEKEAVMDLFEYSGGSRVFTQQRFNELVDNLDVFEIIRLYESEHEKIFQFGEFNAIYGKPI